MPNAREGVCVRVCMFMHEAGGWRIITAGLCWWQKCALHHGYCSLYFQQWHNEENSDAEILRVEERRVTGASGDELTWLFVEDAGLKFRGLANKGTVAYFALSLHPHTTTRSYTPSHFCYFYHQHLLCYLSTDCQGAACFPHQVISPTSSSSLHGRKPADSWQPAAHTRSRPIYLCHGIVLCEECCILAWFENIHSFFAL